jgi:hypothetical protein
LKRTQCDGCSQVASQTNRAKTAEVVPAALTEGGGIATKKEGTDNMITAPDSMITAAGSTITAAGNTITAAGNTTTAAGNTTTAADNMLEFISTQSYALLPVPVAMNANCSVLK